MLDKLVSKIPLPDSIKNLAGGSSGKNEKATIFVTGSTVKEIKVQFNPAEYSISRPIRTSKQKALNADTGQEEEQTVSAESTTLQVALYFDSLSDPSGSSLSSLMSNPGGLLNTAKGAFTDIKNKDFGALADKASSLVGMALQPNTQVNNVCQKFISIVKFDPETHQPPIIIFTWGQLVFKGRVQSNSVQYTMFTQTGVPVRARVTLSIVGEEYQIIKQAQQKTKESPDRTKDRMLPYGDQLWMLAADEYGDPSQWKAIAQANGILNPRKIDKAVRLKVPSIR